MSTLKSPGLVPNQSAFEVDMRNLLRERKANGLAEASTEGEGQGVELASMISQISFRSIQEIDHLISGLQGIRQKLDDDGDRIQRQIGQYVSCSQSIVDLTKIVSDGMTAINTMTPEVIELPKASPADLNKR
jgi:flagellar biosynthesis/type III secretory pathway protein FliH